MSSGFTFGAGATNPPPAFGQTASFGNAAPSPFASAFGTTAQKPFNFAPTQPTSVAPPAFGAAAFNTVPASGQSTFGMPAASAATGFGFNSAAAPSNAFGATPQTQSTPGFFGAAPAITSANTLGFSAPQGGTGLSFGTPARTTASAFGASTFGTAPTTTFGAPPAALPFGAAPPSTGGLTFGTPTAQPNTGLGFGTPTAATTAGGFAFNMTPTSSAASGGLTFGAPAAPTGGGLTFGTPTAPAGGGLTFRTPASTASGGLSFGAPAPTSAGGLTFGQPAPATAASGLTFGQPAPATAASGLTFGQPAPVTAAGGLTFGQPVPASAASGLTFGASTPSTIGGGLTFGAPITGTPTSSTAGRFAPSAHSATCGGGFTMSNASALPAPGLTFEGATPTLQFPPSTKLDQMFALPSATTTSTGLNFGVSTAATKPSFNLTSTSTAAPTASSTTPNTFGNMPAVISTPTTGLSLLPTATTSSGLTFGTPTTSGTQTTGFSMLGSTAATAPATTFGSASLGYGLPSTSTLAFSTPATTRPNVGLGGISATPPKPLASTPTTTTATGQPEIAPKDQPLPNELLQSVEQFKKYLQEQKSHSSEIARFSINDLKKVENDINLVNKRIGEIENELQRNKIAAERLKLDSSQGLKQVEMAQRTFDTPAGLQYDNNAPMSFFIELTDRFELQMQGLKTNIESIDKTVLNNTKLPPSLTSQDLALGMRRLHESFVALAGRLQTLHNQVELQKEHYLDMRKHILRDYTNVFENKSTEMEALEIVLDNITSQQPEILTGPTPFSTLGNLHAQSLATQIQPPQPPAYPFNTGGAPIPGFSDLKPSTIPLFGTNTSFNSTNTSFQLQKPPAGNKRGKLVS